MIEKLKRIFPSIVEAQSDIPMDTDTYLWFSTNENNIVGIEKLDITEKERMLLETILTPYYANQPPVTKREEQWINILFNDANQQELMNDHNLNYRFVYFSFSDDTVDPLSFREAIHGLFPNRVPIIWENNHEGIIIEENQLSEDDMISYNEIIDVLMSDFYMKVHLFIGPYSQNISSARTQYQWVKQSFHTVHYYDSRPVINYIMAVPYLLLEPLGEQSMVHIIESILQDTIKEEELLQTIQIFLECNSNATLAAKKLYMHRNSLQYRVDKFIEKTGIDVKQFEGALSVYLTLLIKNKKHRSL
ncbi:PucR family transcriptional regulator [Aquibacillus rhizosphaerae]|uniref:Helix-turn-helix domain-containing protein n=1 Tax=Aquibacillus rhizosphaerae TaxID=3051431 RepID=A0ABT7LC11_9BACI|nr:helix-turn-helix domain-containing protein [Aquibacillus sp. LR5S19]MDL4842735.1 helix-turn-helix domain-containing protein [Aquibacillus sp. LR5S19]